MVSTRPESSISLRTLALAASSAPLALAQLTNSTTAAPTATTAAASTVVSDGVTFLNPTGYSTKTYNASGAYTTYLPNNVFDDERLNFLWDQVRLATLSSIELSN